ncbi:asparagine synthase-related protein [Spirulina sp. CS-785/01]|uniref:asparagine synthetase B family protein n=1 Tax=Spirulina sp. CS-785/01 TaxID=3021716 RepID=UPI00232A9821|nr:asparagine synthase-related protein [Spirulina sp. CS-785/01]MDB9311709.1 asparagine synthase-related protein [Spirulina sp. CS-785/01]
MVLDNMVLDSWFFSPKKFAQREVPVNPNWLLHWGAFTNTLKPNFSQDNFHIFKTKPTQSPHQRCWVVGEFWLSNLSTLLSQLKLKTGDASQVVAWLWERWGVDCLEELEGMFAFVVWDRQTGRCYLVRDRTGTRTLYYLWDGSSAWIAPRLQSLTPYHGRELDLVALRDYLCCAFVPGERTLWKAVRELRPGTVLCLPEGSVKSYWQPQKQIEPQDFTWHRQQLRFQLEQVVQDYLPPSTPVGVYLSGGLESSCITALTRQFHHAPIHTYSLHFGEHDPYELAVSSLVAQHCRTQHHVLEITPQQIWEQLPVTLAHLDNPIGDPLTVPHYLLAQVARDNCQVILNGEGGDPCFGGLKNQPMILEQFYQWEERNILWSYLTSFKKCATDLPYLLKPEIWQQVQSYPWVFGEELGGDAQYLNRLMLLNIKFKGADHILTKVNNLTTSAFLAGRSPLFDARIVQRAMATPPQYKLAKAEEKAVLKEAVRDLLPDMIIDRPKSGMGVPVQSFFRNYWKGKAKKLLLSRDAAIAPYLEQEIIRDWLNFRGDTWGRYGAKLWLLVSLELWLQIHRKS